jgi:MoaA/NifB/PqqE/SkfB family radical SAM enzyme
MIFEKIRLIFVNLFHKYLFGFKYLTKEKLHNNTDLYFPVLENIIKKKAKIDIRLDLTKQCNLKCVYCHYSLPSTKNIPDYNLNLNDIKQIFANIGDSIHQINLSCGHEPLINKDFIPIIEFLHSYHPKVLIYFVSNCTLLDRRKRLCIVENNVDTITFSIDASIKETYEKIRKGARFEKVIANILALKELKVKLQSTNPKVHAIFVMLNSNIQEAEQFLDQLEFLGIESITFHHLVKEGAINYEEESLFNYRAKFNYYHKLVTTKAKALKIPISIPEKFNTQEDWFPYSEEEVNVQEMREIIPDENLDCTESKLRNVYQRKVENKFIDKFKPRCSFPFKEVHIKQKRYIKPCAYLSGPPLGDLKKEKSILKVFQNEEFSKLRKSMFESEIDMRCRKCPLVEKQISNNR